MPARRAEDVGRVPRWRPGRQHVQRAGGGSRRRAAGRRVDAPDGGGEARPAAHDIGEPRGRRQTQRPVNGRPAQRRIDEDHPAVERCERDGEVHGRRGLPLAGLAAGDDDRARRPLGIEEPEPRAHAAVGLGGDRRNRRPVGAGDEGEVGNDAERRETEPAPDVVGGLETRVQRLHPECRERAEPEAGEEGQPEIVEDAWLRRTRRQRSRVEQQRARELHAPQQVRLLLPGAQRLVQRAAVGRALIELDRVARELVEGTERGLRAGEIAAQARFRAPGDDQPGVDRAGGAGHLALQARPHAAELRRDVVELGTGGEEALAQLGVARLEPVGLGPERLNAGVGSDGREPVVAAAAGEAVLALGGDPVGLGLA